jgi:hypothetical protein
VNVFRLNRRIGRCVLALALAAHAAPAIASVSPAGGVLEPFALEPPVAPQALAFTTRGSRPPSELLFLSDRLGGNLDIYDTKSRAPIGHAIKAAGFGLATNRRTGDVAVGTLNGTVVVYHVTASGAQPFATLTLTSGYASGLAFDGSGDLFASNYDGTPVNGIDEFSAATIAAGGGKPSRTFAPPDLYETHFLAVDGDALVADGFDAQFRFVVVRIGLGRRDLGREQLLQVLGYRDDGTGYPGGLQVDAHGVLIVDNQTGSLLTFAKPWTGAPTSRFSYHSTGSTYTSIALDSSQTTLWAANIFVFSSLAFATNAVPLRYPYWSMGAPTSEVIEEAYVGAAVTRVR